LQLKHVVAVVKTNPS